MDSKSAVDHTDVFDLSFLFLWAVIVKERNDGGLEHYAVGPQSSEILKNVIGHFGWEIGEMTYRILEYIIRLK